MKIIGLLDLDYFYAQCEIIRNPALYGKPVIIVMKTVRENSGAIATCNYEARALKIRSGMPLCLAKKLSNKDSIFLNVDKEYYKEISEKVFEIVDLFSESIEQVSIDEAYFDLSNQVTIEKAIDVCKKMKERIFSELKLTCSIGLSVNKLIAKMASEEKKPNGLTVVNENEILDFIKNKPVGDLHGLGPKSVEILKEKDVETILDLQKLEKKDLIDLFGVAKGEMFYDFARGIDGREINSNREKKQISRMITLRKDSTNFCEMKDSLNFLCERVFKETKNMNKKFKTISVIIINTKFETFTKSKTTVTQISSIEELFVESELLLKNFLSESIVNVRRLGVRVTNFEDAYGFQKKLFDY